MATTVWEFEVYGADADEYIDSVVWPFMEDEGFEYCATPDGAGMYRRRPYFGGAVQCAQIRHREGRVRIDAWVYPTVAMGTLPGSDGEMFGNVQNMYMREYPSKKYDLKGFIGFAVKQDLRAKMDLLEEILTQSNDEEEFAADLRDAQNERDYARRVPAILPGWTGILSVVACVISGALMLFLPLPGLIAGVAGIVLGSLGKRSDRPVAGTAGMTLSIVFTIISVIMLILHISLFALLE